MNISRTHNVLAATLLCALATSTASTAHAQAAATAKSRGILPIPEYSGDLADRAYLAGDLGDSRTDLANKGIQLNVDWVQVVQSVIDGGRDTGTSYNGTLDYQLDLDFDRMGLMPGALLRVRAESRYGNSVNGDSGSILPVNTDAFFPLTSKLDDDIPITVTTLSYTQFLSPTFGLTMGKFDTLDGDPNEFASGRGKSQFMDANFNFNAAMALRLPYSALGGGMVWMPVPPGPKGGITVSSLIFTTTDSSTTSGFDNFDDGLTWTTEADFQYRLGDSNLPGGMNVGFLYSFDQDFAKIGSRFIFQPGQGLSPSTEDQTWALCWSGWQYLIVNDSKAGDAPINLANGMPDHQGLGVFARVGFADQDTNPVEWSASGGIGGRGAFDRPNDTYGVGYYYSQIQSTLLTNFVGISEHTQGFEAFYTIAITPATQLTIDFQLVESFLPDTDTAVILGARLRLVF